MKRVLVVDDDPHLVDMAVVILEAFHYAVATASNGVEALDQIRRQPPDVVLLELMMPVMDGWTFLETCRTDGICSRVPIAVMSARDDLDKAMDLGARAVIRKPFDVAELLAIVEQVS